MARARGEVEAREREIRAEAARARDEHVRAAVHRMDSDMTEERRRLKAEATAALADMQAVRHAVPS